MTQNDDGEYVFSTGRTLYAAMNAIGIDETLGVGCGYDDGIFLKDSWYVPIGVGLNKEEKREFANYVIALWERWANA